MRYVKSNFIFENPLIFDSFGREIHSLGGLKPNLIAERRNNSECHRREVT